MKVKKYIKVSYVLVTENFFEDRWTEQLIEAKYCNAEEHYKGEDDRAYQIFLNAVRGKAICPDMS